VPGFFAFSGEKLRALREEQDRSREQLAIDADLSFVMIAALEYGYRSPSKAALERLAGALGVSPADLVVPDPDLAAAP